VKDLFISWRHCVRKNGAPSLNSTSPHIITDWRHLYALQSIFRPQK
jgi:hypothetical protein